MTDTTTAESGALVPYVPTVLQATPGAVDAFLTLLRAVPEPDDDAAAKIVMQILQAQDLEGLDSPWAVDGLKLYDGRQVVIETIKKMPSDFKEGIGVYLVMDVVVADSGERLVLTSGSVAVVAQLVRAYTLGLLPLSCIPRLAARKSSNGYYPMHLEIVRPGTKL